MKEFATDSADFVVKASEIHRILMRKARRIYACLFFHQS